MTLDPLPLPVTTTMNNHESRENPLWMEYYEEQEMTVQLNPTDGSGGEERTVGGGHRTSTEKDHPFEQQTPAVSGVKSSPYVFPPDNSGRNNKVRPGLPESQVSPS